MAYTEIRILQELEGNENYTLVTAELPGVDLPCYGIVNRTTGIVEMSTSVLPNARKFFNMLNSWEISPPSDGAGDGEDGEPGSLPDMPEIVQ